MGQHLFFLHDGPANDLVTAIEDPASKGSQANTVIQNFNMLTQADQQALVAVRKDLSGYDPTNPVRYDPATGSVVLSEYHRQEAEPWARSERTRGQQVIDAAKDAAAATPIEPGSMSQRVEMYNKNALKIGLFGANCSSARTATLVPERWLATWPDCLNMARIADESGIDFLLPIGRWKGYGGDSDFHGTTLETVTWACGLLAATQRITVFGTVHAPLFHPLIAAKEMVTADHIGNGRFGLNLVAGWNEGEFQMFGVQQREHDERYEFAQEWLDVIKRAWSAEEFDFSGRYFKLSGVRAKPGPIGGTRPVIMNAGSSGAGQAFAMRNCDGFFTSTSGARLAVAGTSQAVDEQQIFSRIVKQVSDIKADGRRYGREIDVYTQGQVICRPTRREAEEYHHYANIECADWSAIEKMLALKNITPQNAAPDEFKAKRTLLASSGIGGYPFVGSPDEIATEFANHSRAGFRGLAVSFVNYLKDVPYFCDEVLPRLARMGLRAKNLSSSEGRT